MNADSWSLKLYLVDHFRHKSQSDIKVQHDACTILFMVILKITMHLVVLIPMGCNAGAYDGACRCRGTNIMGFKSRDEFEIDDNWESEKDLKVGDENKFVREK